MEYRRCDVNTLIGMTLINVTVDYNRYDPHILFTEKSGRVFKMYHDQDCCETVRIEDICGDLWDLVGNAPITIAEESSNKEDPPKETEYTVDSYTWTFYRFATWKGFVTIRWYGESNGYYSEKVTFCELIGEE